jgi:NAD(P)-dependent dehydrogenase (short-subunit alcohol dehydrogenase family)
MGAIRSQMETNFFGPLRAMKAIIPSMREEKSGVIVNVTSAEFWEPHAGASVYSASKFAFEGLLFLSNFKSIHITVANP